MKTEEKRLIRKEKEAKELAKREKELAKKKPAGYLVYLIMILSLVYITDEVASIISINFQSNIITEFLVIPKGLTEEAAKNTFDSLGFISYPVMILAFLYKPLADRFGRKPFLFINTFFMAIGLFIIYLSKNIVIYMAGATLISFFVMHDMHCVYLMEVANDKNRGTMYAISKTCAVLGTFMIPFCRKLFMGNNSSMWHFCFLIPAIFGFVASILALAFARETDAFEIKRISYLKKTDEERENDSKKDKELNAQGGLINAIKFIFKHHQLSMLFLACSFFFLGSQMTSNYNTLMSYSFGLDEESITSATMLYSVGSAFFVLSMGFISDIFGRKIVSCVMTGCSILMYILFIIGLTYNWPLILIGLFLGGYTGSYWATGDTMGAIMWSESSPTNLRSSVVTVQTINFGLSGIISIVITMICQSLIPVQNWSIPYLIIATVGPVISLFILMKNVGETKGLDLKTVTGEEWDRKKIDK